MTHNRSFRYHADIKIRIRVRVRVRVRVRIMVRVRFRVRYCVVSYYIYIFSIYCVDRKSKFVDTTLAHFLTKTSFLQTYKLVRTQTVHR